MQLTFSEKAPIMPQYATGNATKEAEQVTTYHEALRCAVERLHINAAH